MFVTGKNPLLDIALKLEEVALQDPYFVDRKLYPNVDFYSGLIYQAMGFPADMFTVLLRFRAQPVGSLTGRNYSPIRPKDLTTTPVVARRPERDYVPMASRS